MTNPITGYSGVEFLFFYAFVSAVTLWACHRWLRSQDPSRSMPPPSVPSRVDPYEIAYLRGGQNEVTRIIIVGLAERGYLTASGEGIRQTETPPPSTALSSMEQTVYDWFSTLRTGREVFSGELPPRVGAHCLGYEERLQQERLLTDDSYDGWNALLLGGAIIGGIGVARLLVGLSREQPVGFLIVMGIAAILILIGICSPGRMTARGKAYIDQFKTPSLALEHANGGHYALATAVMGLSVLSGTPYEEFNKTFQKGQSSSGGCGASCGGGDGGGGDGGCGGCGGCG